MKAVRPFPCRRALEALFLGLVLILLLPACQRTSREPVSVKADSVSLPEKRDLPDLRYGEGERQTLDLYLPEEGEGPFALLIYIHGGAWISGDKQDGQQEPWVRLRQDGYAVACVNYRLIGEAVYPEPLEDCAAAISYLLRNAKLYHLDAARYALCGESAGAQYALMCAACPELEKPAALVLWYPVTDLGAMYRQVQDDEAQAVRIAALLKAALPVSEEQTDAWLRENSPVSHAGAYRMPILLEHGTADTAVPYAHSAAFVSAVEQAGGQITFVTLEGAQHGGPAFSQAENIDLIAGFLDTWVKGTSQATQS